MQSVSSRIWTRVTVSISNDDNHYTTGKFYPNTNQIEANKDKEKKNSKYLFNATSIYFETFSVTNTNHKDRKLYEEYFRIEFFL